MRHLWQNQILWLSICCTTLVFHNFVAKERVKADELSPLSAIESNSQSEGVLLASPWLIAEKRPNYCQSLAPEYQEHYSFETRNYNISICRQQEKWFYYRESKSNSDSILFVPAEIVFGGNTFRAVSGKATYFVGINSNGYYSSVMYGNNQMIFEPELSRTSSIVKQKETPAYVGESVSNNTNNTNSANLASGNNPWKVCTEDPNDIHPNLNGWQRFIGRSISSISDYAAVEGHDFKYSQISMARAMVETTDGLMVTIDVFKSTETIDNICVKPIGR